MTTLVDFPKTLLSDLEYVHESHKKQIFAWNDISVVPENTCMNDVVYEQVISRPEHEAICAWDGSFTYRELWGKVQQLAQKLIELDVGPGMIVPLCFEKSAWATVAMLAVLEAGAAFCPLDATQPSARLERLVVRLEARILLCSRKFSEDLSSIVAQALPTDADTFANLPNTSLDRKSRATPDGVAYVVWTSGSTGEPKGVVVDHRAYCSGAKAHAPGNGMSPESRILQYASYVFDASILESITVLMIGATVCVPSEEARLNELATVLNQMRVDWTCLTPSVIGLLTPSTVPNLKTLCLMGEAMTQEHLSTWSGIKLINGYGPAECTVASMSNQDASLYRDPSLIGHGTGVRCWLVDPENYDRLVPPGCVAELLLEGPGLARGYLNDPERTSDAFIINPAWAATDDNNAVRRMYKTGDLVRYKTSNGMIYFLGRKDTQVKLHGQRIELGEIEHHLAQEPTIRQSIIMLPKAGICRARLVAVVSLQGTVTAGGLMNAKEFQLVDEESQQKSQPIIATARERLSTRLPTFMIPSIWLVVQSIPLLKAGKLDRKGVLHRVQELSEEDYAKWVQKGDSGGEPTTELESQLRSVWANVLNLRPSHIGMKQSFLSLGGDSISAMMVQSQCKKNNIGITVQDIVRAKSLAQLASFAKTVDRKPKQVERIEELFDLSPIQLLYFCLPREAGHFNQSTFVRLARPTNPATLHQATKSIINRHSMLRARFSLVDDEWKQRVTTDVAGSYSFKVHNDCSKEDAIPIMSTTQASLDPVNGPLFAVDLFVKDDCQLLFMTGHHLVIDLVSWRVILQDVEDFLIDPQSAADSDTSLAFQTWCDMQTQHAQRLAPKSVLPVNEIPSQSFEYWDMDEQSNRYGDVRCEGFQLETAATALVTSKCHDTLRTDTVDILIAAMIFSFAQTFTDRTPPTIFNEGHGREVWDQSIDLSRTVGWFTSMYPIFVPPECSLDFVEVLRRVKDYRRAVPGKGRPYFASRMLTRNGAKKFAGHWPLEFTFNYLGIYQQLEREGALLQPVDEMAGEARGAGGKADVGFETPRFGLFEISAVVAQGQLRFSFTFNQYMKHQEKISAWISACQDTLVSMPQRLAQMSYQPTLSDYPLLTMTHDDLDQLINHRLANIGITDLANVEDVYRCSQIQQGLLISKQRDSSHYAVEGVYKVNSKDGARVSARRLIDAWQKVIDRHASLRTIFVESSSQDESLYDQVVLRHVQANILRLQHRTEIDVLDAMKSQAPMEQDDSKICHRLTVYEASAGGVFCKIELSHAIMDGASMSILFQELVSIYEGQPLSEKGPLYSDYISFLQTRPPQAGIGYWKSYLAGVESTLFPSLNDAAGTQRQLRSKRLQLDDIAGIQNFCNLHGITMANIFHTAWALTLRCYTGSSDVSFGYLMSTRDLSIDNVESLVGYMVNMLVCRVTLDSQTSVTAILQQVQDDLSNSQSYCHTALSEVLHALKFSGTSLFNTSLSYRKVPAPTMSEQHAISFDECYPYYDPTEYSVSINIEAFNEGAAVDLDYWTDCLSDRAAENVAATFLQALKNIVEYSEMSVGQMSTLSDLDRSQILEWNNGMPETIEKCVHEVVSEQVNIRPSAQAIRSWDGNFTYAELDRLAENLANYLRIFGVGPETFVCLCFEKSAYTIIAMLGVLKAGGAFVSLDPLHPTAALELRIKDTESRVVLTSPCYNATFAGMNLHVASIHQVFFDGLRPMRRRMSISATAKPNNPACVIYTSGSTGKPKGVVLEHRALVTSSEAHGSILRIGPETRSLQFASYTFDNNLEEIFTTLQRGGTVCVPSDHDRLNNLAAAVRELEANFMDLTPTVATYLNPSEMPTIKSLSLGGEALTKSVLDVWGDKVRIINQYGPSECSINSTARPDVTKSSDPSNIGRSIGSVSWVVDASDHNKLLSIGCEGELLIEGPILARGYLNDAEKTSKVFIENPEWTFDRKSIDKNSPPRRMYKTGDLVRYNSDGTICYIGRKDQQVKLHGQRIELGEIEYHVRNHLEADWQFGVELITPSAGAKALALFVCPQEDKRSTVPEKNLLPMSSWLIENFKTLEASLVRALPKHMVPSLYIPLARLPLTSSGKLDRKQLHAISTSLTENQMAVYRLAGSSGREPSTDVERTLAGLWESILNLDAGSVGMEAQFFGMGGDSISAIRLVAAARSKGIGLTVATLLRNATLSELCESVATSEMGEMRAEKPGPQPFELLPATIPIDEIMTDVSSLCKVDKTDIEDMYPCTSLQEGLFASSTTRSGAYVALNIYNISEIDSDKFKQAWQAVVYSEPILRTRIVYTETLGFLQVVVKQPITWSEYSNLSDMPDDEKSKPAYNGAELAGYSLVKEDNGRVLFIWTVHHALYDGWSINLILDKVQAHYIGSELEASGAYGKFMQYLSDVDIAASESFWESRLSDVNAPQFPMLPQPSYRPNVTKMLSRTTPVTGGAKSDITLPTLIRAAWALTVAAYSQSDDVVYAETVNGRDAPISGIMDMIGPTFATIPVSVKINSGLTVSEYVKRIQDEFTETMPYQHAGLQHIARINQETAKACDFQNLIAIANGASGNSSDFWSEEVMDNAENNFFTHALTMSFEIVDNTIRTHAHFDPQLISEWQLNRLVRHFECAFSQLRRQDNASLKLDQIHMISDEDETSVKLWNGPPPASINKCVHEMISHRAKTVPMATPAICAWDVELTYQQLEDVTSTLAHRLKLLGIGPGCHVPVCFEKSGLAAIAMLAILKAGASFVAIDGDSPTTRLETIITDVEAQIVLCSSNYSKVCNNLGIQSITLDLKSILDTPKRSNTIIACSGSDVAYTIFTSGSTGKPKGTMVSHAAFVSGVAAHAPAMGMKSTSRVLQFASYTFDASIVEIFSTLMLGGCVCVPDEKARLNDIAKVINQMSVTWTLLTPSFVQTISPSDVPTLKTLVLGGEAMGQNHLSTWANKLHLVNAYGPSECAVVATVNSHVVSSSHPSDIGRAVGSHCFIVNQHNHDQLVPVGTIGELVVAGPILARGYLKNPSKTAEAFVRHPAWMSRFQMSQETTGNVMYKTGDLVKYAEDGSLLYMGRKDNQTKLHGQRLELGEVEHHLGHVSTLQHAIAMLPQKGLFEKKLIAILSFQEKLATRLSHNGLQVTPRKDAAAYIQGVREYLSDRLPPYMVPSNWVVISDFPLLPSGKLDRRQLISWVEDVPEDVFQAISGADSQETGVLGSKVEQCLQMIWSTVLHLPSEQIGLDQNFLYLGGDSISALQVTSQCRNQGLGVTVQDVIRCQSISDLATRVTLAQESTYADEEYDKPFDLSPIQRLFFDWVGDNVNHFNQSTIVRLTQRQRPEKVATAIETLVTSHTMLKARFNRSTEGGWNQRLTKDALNAYRFTSHSGVFSSERLLASIRSTQESLDIHTGPLFAADLFESDENGTQVLALVAHHLVVDFVSWGIVLADLESLILSGRVMAQSTLPFQTWSNLQAKKVQSEELSEKELYETMPSSDLSYWGLADQPNNYAEARTLDFVLDIEKTQRLLGPCNRSLQTEVVDILLASILYSFSHAFPDRTSIPPVFNEGHGRQPWDSSLDLSHTLGWFTTISPVFLPSEASREEDIIKVIRWVKDQRSRQVDKGRQYFAHRMLTEHGKESSAGHWPMEVAFNYLGQQQSITKNGTLLEPLDGLSSDYDIGASVPRFAMFEISASVVDGKMKMSLAYNPKSSHQPGIRAWAANLKQCLVDSSSRLLDVEPQLTLSSFPLLPMAYNTIDILYERLASVGITSISAIEDVYTCSPMQRGILLSQVKNSGQYMYNSVFSVHPRKNADQVEVRRLANAWGSVVRKHTSLRTIFIPSLSQEGLMDQAVLSTANPVIQQIPCKGSSAADFLDNQGSLPFTPGQLPHRFTICYEDDGKILAKLEMSHAICDGTSVPIIFQDLAEAYTRESAGEEKALRYSDYVSHIKKTTHESDVNYWRRYLEYAQPCYFPTLGNNVEHINELRTLESKLDETSSLQLFCAQRGVTLSNLLQLVWALVLRAYSGNDSVCFGYLSSGRDVPLEQIEGAVGLFISMLVCRMEFSGDMQASVALEQIRDDYLQSMSHHAFSLGDIQHELQLSGKSLFNTAFTFQRRLEMKNTKSQGINFKILEAYDPSEYEVTVNVEACETEVIVSLNYWTDCLSEQQAKNVSETFNQILSSIVRPEVSEQTIGALDMCPESHRNQLLEWNQQPLPRVDECVHDIIDRQSKFLPLSTPAVCSWDEDLTYRQLMTLSKRLSRHLRALGVGPETYVPICFEKSTWAVVAMLGILHAGGAFVPLEPSHPESRIKYILSKVNARLVLSSSKYNEKFAEYADITTFIVDDSLAQQSPPALEDAVSKVNPDHTAYLIFTSGTTGDPKGTIISHRAFATGATEHAPAILMRQDSRVLQFSNLCFDASVMEILTTLITGACVCIPDDEERMNDIAGAISRMSVTWTLLTPSVAKVLEPGQVPSLKVLVTGGEAMQPRHIAKWQATTSLVNAYGPSECAVIATTSIKVDEQRNNVNDEPAVIGKAVGCRSWIVNPDDHNQLMPIGSVGELVVDGNTVARGYLNNEEKTAKAFLPRPSWMSQLDSNAESVAPKTIYMTGDLVRYKPDGDIVYVSRKDTQVKLNGLRIELGEIEHRVKENLPENIQAAVANVAPAGQQETIAVFFSSPEYVIPESSNVTAVDSLLLPMSEAATTLCKGLKSAIAGVLPGYMIPSLFVPLSQMPWTASGKLDRPRLRSIISSMSQETTVPYKLANFGESRAPTTNMEIKLQGIWESVLNLEHSSVSLDDGFFVLGGDSVAAMKLVAAARAEQLSLSVLDIFRNPSLSEMAKACSYLETGAETTLKPFGLLNSDTLDSFLDEVVTQCQIEKDQLADAYPCSALQEGLITLSIKQAGAYVAHNVFRLPEGVEIDQFKAAWQRAVQDMDILRTRIVHTSDGAFIQAVLKEEMIEWHTAENTEDVIQSPAQIPEHSGSPLMRFTLVNEESQKDRYLVFSIHHALYDGWSMPRMLQRVEDIYFDGEMSTPNASYSHFIRYLSQSDKQACDRFWQSKFDGLESSHFPTSTSAEQQGSSELLHYTVKLPKKPTGSGITLPSVIRAAWGLLLSAHTGSQDVVFGETMTGRDIPIDGIIDMLGPTLTTVPTRILIEKSWTIADYLQKVHEIATEVIPYQHTGLQHIRRLNTETATACDFQNLLVIQTADGSKDESKMWFPQNTGVSEGFFTYPLVVECNTEGSSIHVDAHYNDSVISQWHIQRLLYQLESILGQLLSLQSDTEIKVEDIQVLSEQDVSEIQSWNNYRIHPVNECIHELFLLQADLLSRSQAVCAWDGNFTYGELKKHATILSMHLKRAGVGPEVLVPFCMDKSRWAVVAQIGGLMSGGGIVPLDPAHPLTRHSEIITDTKATILLCSPQYEQRYSDLVKNVIPIGDQTMSAMAERQPQSNSIHPGTQVTSKNTAYVIFTSGSTGRPKGVVVEHEAFCTSSEAYCSAMLMDPGSRVFNFASVTFDVGLMENLSPLTMGACVCIPNNEQKMTDVAAAINNVGATWAFLTPSVANLIEPAAVPRLKVLVCGGEAMAKENVRKWADCVSLVNGYGPTEASVISVVNSQVLSETEPSNIGYAHANGYAWVAETDNHNRLAPLGCAGELLLEGPLLAREYLGDYEKTAKAFIDGPAWTKSFQTKMDGPRRVYKTGDLVRYNDDGSIQFIGRKDNQIKLHGQRIELGEIEHKFGLHQHIQHAVALLPKVGLCKNRLVAVVSMSSISSGNTSSSGCTLLQGDSLRKAQGQMEEVREFLSTLLPGYMMPTICAIVETIPFMVSGKLDRKQVERWVQGLDEAAFRQITSRENEAQDAAPITGTVQQLREIWASVFNIAVDKIEPSRSFMSQGGDSLISMSIIAKCRKIGITLSLQEVLKSSSLFQIAKILDSRGHTTENTKITGIKEKVDEAFELSPVQRLYFQLAGSSSDHTKDGRFNQSQLLRLKRKTEASKVKKAVEVIVEQHSMFRARFQKDREGNWHQRIVGDISTSFRFLEHQVESPRDLLQLLADSQRSLDIEYGPLFAVELFNTKQYGQVLSLIAHHLIIDVVSWGIILRQLEELLTSQEETIEKPFSFQVWTALQADHAASRKTSAVKNVLPFNVRRADMKFWGMNGRANTYGDVVHESFQLDKLATELALGTTANKALGTQPVEILITALLNSFRSVFSQRPLPALWNESHGRDTWDNSIDIALTTGWFTSLYPVAIPQEDANTNSAEMLKRVKDLRRSLPANGREYFAHRYLTPDGRWRFSDHMPMEILLNYTGQSQGSAEHSDSLMRPFDLPRSEHEERATADVGPSTARMALFEVSAGVSNGQIRFSFMWNKHMEHQSEIQQWVRKCETTLKTLAVQLSKSRPEPTLSDYPLLPTTYSGLQKHVNETFREVGISSLDEVENMYVTAPTQEGLLLSQIRNPEQYVNFVISDVNLPHQSGRVDIQRLARAWQKVVDRHQSLRTAFVYSVCKGHAFDQIALKNAKGGAKIVESQDEDYEKELNKISLREVNKTRRPPLPHQLSICMTPSGQCYIKLELNHAVIDGGSGALITRDLALAYENRLPDGPKPLYSDYVKYINDRVQGIDVSFWKTYLDKIERCHLPPLDPAPKEQNRLNAIYLKFDRFAEMQAFCRANELTLSNVMLAAWGLVLRHYTSSEDVCFGNLTAGREAPVDGIQDTVGAFINMLVCRVKFGESKTIREVIRDIQSDYLDSLPHQHCSLAKIQHDLGFSGEPLYNTAVSIQNQISTRDAEKEGDSIEIEPITDHDPTEVCL